MAKQPTNRATTQTTRINGARVVIKTTASGKVTVKPAAVLEWQLQSAQVRALRQMPEYGKLFLLAGDMNAAKRGATATAQAIASGMTPGEPDLRVYLLGGRIGLIENKVGNAALTEEDAAAQAVALVRGWLAVDMAQNAATLACGAISAQK
jgi:hypothetical protein